MPQSISNKYGFTLVEIMVAMVIMMVGLLGMLHSLNIAMEHNLRNHLRDEAVSVADEQLNELKIKPYDNLSAAYAVKLVPSRIRGVGKNYSVVTTTEPVGANARAVAVRVAWSYKNMSTTHELRTVRSK